MEALYIQHLEEDRAMMEGVEREKHEDQEEGGAEASYAMGSTTDEETDEDSEPEPPPVIRRKVSFADAFGLNLVSVKEFDNAEVSVSEISQAPESEANHPSEEFYMSCLFTVPSSPEELDQRLQAQLMELESIELLPGTSTLRGIIRVVNLCYSKAVYARMTLDRWTSYFELLAEYVPGSSDRKTDRFTFKYTLVPPFEREGTRLEFCLRYETPVGTFWANNNEMNYVMFCHQKGLVKEHGPQVQEENAGYRSKRSCLKANRRGSAQEKTRETSNASTVVAEAEATRKADEAERKTADGAQAQSPLYREEHKSLVDSIKGRQRAARLARVRDYLSQRRQQAPKAYSHDSAKGQKVSQPLPTPWGDPAGFLQEKQSIESPQVLTYHQIPLLTLDWNSGKTHQWGTADMEDIWTGRAKMTLSKATVESLEDTPSVNDMWETFRNGTDDPTDEETSVCDVWQAFLNGPSCTAHSDVPESEWLQTAASVSPSNDKEPKTQYAASSEEHEFQVGTDTPTALRAHTSAACQLLSDFGETSPANVALNTADHRPAEACVSSAGDDNTGTQEASQRSQTNSVTDTPQEFSLKAATPVSEGSIDSLTKCHKHAMREQEREGITGGAESMEREEPFTPHTADLVTSSGESETTDMTPEPESQNASAVDRISQGARLDKGLPSGSEEEAAGTTHNVMDDTLAFRGTIIQGTKGGEGFVFSTPRQEAEEGHVKKMMANKVSTEEVLFRQQETQECEISRRYTDEKQREEFRENDSDENEMRPAHSHAEESNPNQMCEGNFKLNQVMANNFKLDESESKDVASNSEEFEKTGADPSYSTTSEETKTLIGADAEMTEILNEEAWQQLNSPWQRGHASINSQVHIKQSGPMQAGEEPEDSTSTQIQEDVALKSEPDEHVLVLNQTEEGKSLSCDGMAEEEQETNPSPQARRTAASGETMQVFQRDRDTSSLFPTDQCNSNLEVRWSHSLDNMKGRKEDVGREIGAEEVTAKENVAKRDTSTELQHQPETSERTEEDMSQRDKDECVSIEGLKIEAPGELMGNVENPREERKNAPADLKEHELSAEVESSPRVESKKLSEGTKDPITVESTAVLEAIELELEETFIERYGEDLLRDIWEEVFGRKVEASHRDATIVGGMERELKYIPDITQDCHLLVERDFNDDFDSDVFSMTELPTDPNSSFLQGLQKTSATKSNECSLKGRSQPLTEAEQTQFLSESQTDSNSSACLSPDLIPTLAAQSRQSLTEPAQSPPEDQENSTQIKERSVTHQETGRQMEDCAVAHKESFNRPAHPSHKHLSSSPEKSKESGNLVWWSLLYILSHITRLLICAFLVAGFFIIVFLYDFPAFFVLYVFSLCWWVCKCMRHRAVTNKRMVELTGS